MKYGLIGEKLGHSFSKEIHETLNDYSYELCEIKKEDLASFMTEGAFAAINVTIPYKEAVLPYLYYIDDAAAAIGAVNTIVNKSGHLYGYNTDFYGMSALFRHIGIDPCGKKAAILGTGGTAKTARAVLKSMGACEIITVSRREGEGIITYDELYSQHSDVDIIVNTTPVGMYPDNGSTPIELTGFRKLKGVIDAVYNPLRTRLISDAWELGIPAEGGLYMLVAQAVMASEIFLGKSYPKGDPERVYKLILSSKENIVLTGMPSSGKSTVGKTLARLLGREFLDTDAMIEEKAGIKISEIFAKYGEAHFRRLEADTVMEAAKRSSVIIATGGGVPLLSDNIRELRKNGRILFLDRPLEELTPTSDRPLALDTDAIKKRYEERYPIYTKTADMSIKVEGTPEALAEKIIRTLIK